MKIFYLSLHPPLHPGRVATGNQVRAAGISAALAAAGHEVESAAPLPAGQAGGQSGCYASSDELARLLEAGGAEALIVGYWSLLAHLPPNNGLPVVLDFIAPRLLEAMYQEAGALQHESRRLLALLPRADHFLVGNRRQADLLLGLLLQSGFDCRERAPISELPIAVSGSPVPFERGLEEIRLVSAGVDWPWRQSGDYLAAAEAWCRLHPRFQLHRLSGAYPGEGQAGMAAGLATYADMQALLARCHIGLELGRRNTEREFSQSFRLADYLQAGLPVVLNAWLPAAEAVRRYNAGWVIEDPDELPALLDELDREPETLQAKAAGARRLGLESLNYRQACRPLLSWLERPWRPAREAFISVPGAAAGADSDLPEQGPGRRLQHVLAEAFRLLFCRRRPALTPDTLMLTRADLFPADHGAAVKILRTAEALSRLGGDVWLCTDDRREYCRFRQGEMQRLRFPFWLRLLALPRPVALLRLLLRGLPASNAFLYFPLSDENYILRVLYLCVRHPIGAYLAEFPAYVRPLRVARRLFGGRLLLVEHNVEYQRIRAQVADLSAPGYRYLKAVELRMCAAADAVVTVSEQDRQTLIGAGADPRKLHTIPHGVDLELFGKAAARDVRRHYGIPSSHVLLVYHGTYSYPPNLEAMQVMADELLPRLRARGLAVSVLAIGSKPPARTLDRNIHFTGSIDRLEEVLPAADLAVVPLLSGGGTRMKILDYFAAGVPVISTGKGIEGIPVRGGRDAIIADGYEEICAAVEDLVRRPAEARRLAEAARLFVADLGWDAIARRYLPLLGRRKGGDSAA